jgi:hypothetical protein
MRTSVLIASALALTMLAPVANALTVINQDKTVYTLTVHPTGGKMQEVKLKASGKVNASCSKGCELSFMNEKASYDGKVAKVWIKGGKFVKM